MFVDVIDYLTSKCTVQCLYCSSRTCFNSGIGTHNGKWSSKQLFAYVHCFSFKYSKRNDIVISGSVFVDGQEKTTKLPPVTEGSVVTFDTEVLQPDKVRVTIEVSERIVTFDWTLDRRQSGSIPLSAGALGGGAEASLFFLAKFSSSGWVVSVE